MLNAQRSKNVANYRIKVKGLLDRKWADWFNGLTIAPIEDDITLLSGPVTDQSALHGILAKIRDLGLTLLSVEMVENVGDEKERKCIHWK